MASRKAAHAQQAKDAAAQSAEREASLSARLAEMSEFIAKSDQDGSSREAELQLQVTALHGTISDVGISLAQSLSIAHAFHQ